MRDEPRQRRVESGSTAVAKSGDAPSRRPKRGATVAIAGDAADLIAASSARTRGGPCFLSQRRTVSSSIPRVDPAVHSAPLRRAPDEKGSCPPRSMSCSGSGRADHWRCSQRVPAWLQQPSAGGGGVGSPSVAGRSARPGSGLVAVLSQAAPPATRRFTSFGGKRSRPRPNPSLERRPPTAWRLGRGTAFVYHRSRGPGATPSGSPQLER